MVQFQEIKVFAKVPLDPPFKPTVPRPHINFVYSLIAVIKIPKTREVQLS